MSSRSSLESGFVKSQSNLSIALPTSRPAEITPSKKPPPKASEAVSITQPTQKQVKDVTSGTVKYEPPSWAGKPPSGLHLDVVKNGTHVEKFLIDEKSHYLFGRLRSAVDVAIDHASCSRVHAALVYHKHLSRIFLIDLGSTHGTFMNGLCIEPHRPVQVPIDTTLSFGASTRQYTLRERPNIPVLHKGEAGDGNDMGESSGPGLLGFPENDREIDDLTEYNTAHNRRLGTLSIDDSPKLRVRNPKRRACRVYYKEEEDIINPEEVDPSIGRFRNLVRVTVVSNKKPKLDSALSAAASLNHFGLSSNPPENIPSQSDVLPEAPAMHSAAFPLTSKSRITSAPEVAPPELALPRLKPVQVVPEVEIAKDVAPPSTETPRKIYAKEAWPGKKPTSNLLSV